jgi:23S rRNA (adenine2503-C2)-methyltransferase
MQIEKKTYEQYRRTYYVNFLLPKETKLFVGIRYTNGCGAKAPSFEDMTNISKETRTMLESNFVINHIKVDTIQRSDDGTIKNAVCTMV